MGSAMISLLIVGLPKAFANAPIGQDDITGKKTSDKGAHLVEDSSHSTTHHGST